MKNIAILSLLAAGITAHAAKLFLAGDSTCAKGGGGGGTQGWGAVVGTRLNLPVNDMAMAGRSARSYTREGRFSAIANQVKPGDFVVIEFGHNDGGGLSSSRPDNGRADCGGTGAETCQTTFNGMKETVLTFPTYLKLAASQLSKAGANVIIASQTPNNICETGTCNYGVGSRFGDMAKLAAKQAGVVFIDHGWYVSQAYTALGAKTVNTFYPLDHVHTSVAGANVVADAFIKGLSTSESKLRVYIKK